MKLEFKLDFESELVRALNESLRMFLKIENFNKFHNFDEI